MRSLVSALRDGDAQLVVQLLRCLARNGGVPAADEDRRYRTDLRVEGLATHNGPEPSVRRNSRILAFHALIHAAESQFFRNAIRSLFEPFVEPTIDL